MLSSFSHIDVPFVLLDSSSILRSSEINIETITRNNLQKYPSKISRLMKQAEKTSKSDNLYYQQIIELQKTKVISILITYEAFNHFALSDSTQIITLFRNNQNMNLPTQNSYNDSFVFWDDKVDLKIYNKAALALTNAKCVVIDSKFIDLSVGKSLIDYIPSSCKKILVGRDINNVSSDINSFFYNASTKELLDILFHSSH